MKKIIALISKATNNEAIIQSTIQMAKLFDSEVTVSHFVEAPANWENLGRTERDQHPQAKRDMNEARLRMDQLLLLVRKANIRARKDYLLL